jgi:hypothetical protein
LAAGKTLASRFQLMLYSPMKAPALIAALALLDDPCGRHSQRVDENRFAAPLS